MSRRNFQRSAPEKPKIQSLKIERDKRENQNFGWEGGLEWRRQIWLDLVVFVLCLLCLIVLCES